MKIFQLNTLYKNKENILIIALVLLAAFFRLWMIRQYAVFLGDEGRDMIVMRKIFTEGNIPFIGPTASVGGFYLGPIYYWMAAPFLLLSNFDPIGPSIFVAIVGILTVYLLFHFARQIAGFYPAILASSLYAVAPLVVKFSRSSWNPNPLPFFALLIFYTIYQARQKKKLWYFLIAGAAYGISIQLHYLAILLAPLAILTTILGIKIKKIPTAILFSIIGFIITISPFLLFEIKNHFPNSKTILEFVTRGSTVGYESNFFFRLKEIGTVFIYFQSNTFNTTFSQMVLFTLLAIGAIIIAKKIINKEQLFSFLIALIWFFGGIVMLALYKGTINDHYLEFLFPAPFLLLAFIVSFFWHKKWGKLVVIIIWLFVFSNFLLNGFYRNMPNKQIDQTKEIASIIKEKSRNEPYNFALVSPGNSDHAYLYYLDILSFSPTKLEQQITSQLLVVCEGKVCKPLSDPSWQVAAFGEAEIESEWSLDNYGIKIYRIVHSKSSTYLEGKPAKKD